MGCAKRGCGDESEEVYHANIGLACFRYGRSVGAYSAVDVTRCLRGCEAVPLFIFAVDIGTLIALIILYKINARINHGHKESISTAYHVQTTTIAQINVTLLANSCPKLTTHHSMSFPRSRINHLERGQC
jgi:hypothetical protein